MYPNNPRLEKAKHLSNHYSNGIDQVSAAPIYITLIYGPNDCNNNHYH